MELASANTNFDTDFVKIFSELGREEECRDRGGTVGAVAGGRHDAQEAPGRHGDTRHGSRGTIEGGGAGTGGYDDALIYCSCTRVKINLEPKLGFMEISWPTIFPQVFRSSESMASDELPGMASQRISGRGDG